MRESIEYPIFNLSYPIWDVETIGDFFIYNNRYKSDDDFYNKYYLNQDFVDCKGKIYRIVGKSPIESKFQIFRSKVSILEFEELHKTIDLDELKKVLKEKSFQIENNAARTELHKQIENSKSIEELLKGC